MGHPKLHISTFLMHSLLFCFFFFSSSCNSARSSSSCSLLSNHSPIIKASPDRQSLLSFKSAIEDPSSSLASWNGSLHHCKWYGVTCGCRHPERVTGLDLSSSELAGPVLPALGNLSFLSKIDLSNNGFHGRIPPELGRLFRLRNLSLDSNSLEGEVPKSLSRCSRLRRIGMGSNKLQGELPMELGYLSSLTHLVLSENSLSGSIPLAMGNLSSLTYLDLSNNTLSGSLPAALIGNLSSLRALDLAHNQLSGVIPPTIGNLSSLHYLDLSSNNLSGGIPPIIGSLFSLKKLNLRYNALSGGILPALGKLAVLKELDLAFNNLTGEIPYPVWHNLSSLEFLQLAANPLSGSLPSDIGNALPRLQSLSLFECGLHGPIPMSLANASNLENIQLASNLLTGIIPPNLGNLRNLFLLILYGNQLEAENQEDWSFLTALTNCTNLNVLELAENNLGGVLPHSMANLSSVLKFLILAENHISESLPPEIGNLVGLTIFDASRNLLRGSIPESIGMLRRLQNLLLDLNSFSEQIPSTLGNLTLLNELYLSYNNLTGTIPSNIGSCQKLTLLDLRSNKLTGAIPRDIFFISGLSRGLDLSLNSLTGSIPSEVGNLKNLGILDISGNKLSGQIPTSLGKCQLLEILDMGGNFFQGSIPSSLSALRGIKILDLSHNNLSGSIPSFLKNFQGLYYLNLSFNNFEGEMPRGGVFDNLSAISVLGGNNKLCGGNPELQLQPCHFHETRKKHSSPVVLIICIACSLLFLFVLFCLLAIRYLMQNSRRKSRGTIEMERQLAKVSYAELVRATNGFSASNLIGVGSFGSVYKAMLDENIVAVKVLNLQQRGASKSFIAECEALRNIRHRNLVKILTACSSVDFRGNDFKAIVFEFMSNGNLESWLHPDANLQNITNKLNFLQRLNIAIDVAAALDYLHHHGDVPVVHCDLKPSNILLDDDMTAHVGDFGLSKFLMETNSEPSSQSISSIGLKGTIGYVAPEYGMANRVSTSGDVYSYGILLLEMFTGKRPTDEIFKGGQSLRKFVEMALPDQVRHITDSNLLLDGEDGEATDDVQSMDDTKTLDCIASLLRIGLACSNEMATERMEMGVVTREVQKLKDIFLN